MFLVDIIFLFNESKFFLFIFFACPKKTKQKKRPLFLGILACAKPAQKLLGICEQQMPESRSFLGYILKKRI
jgi:hypothetical protein